MSTRDKHEPKTSSTFYTDDLIRLSQINHTQTSENLKLFLESMVYQRNFSSSESPLKLDNTNKTSISPVQHTSADGFFNRKRGRPPKNRFVQVYKNMQLNAPQAVFTSFKLERQQRLTATVSETHKEIAKVESKDWNNFEPPKLISSDVIRKEREKCDSGEIDTIEQHSMPYAKNEVTEREQKLVRSTGTFFPANNICAEHVQKNLPAITEISNEADTNNNNEDMPEDLSVRKEPNKDTNQILNTKDPTYSYLHMFYLLNLYRQTQQFPSFMQFPEPNLHCLPTDLHTKDQNIQNITSKTVAVADHMPNDCGMTPFGYSRYRFNEDCGLPRCNYRQRQTHFHCDRNDCQYSFCDRARFWQHSKKHKNLDLLLGNDFKQFRPNIECSYASCAQNSTSPKKSSSHFHCLKCSFVCYETNKISSHRRLHSKIKAFKKAGFRKFSFKENCKIHSTNECIYNKKQTHYHCFICDCSVLTKAQIITHRHMAENSD